MKILIFFLALLVLSISFVFALPNDANNRIDFTYPDPPANTSTYNVSHSATSDYATNSGQLEGRDTATLKTYLQGLYDLVYCKLTGCTMTGPITMGGNDIISIKVYIIIYSMS